MAHVRLLGRERRCLNFCQICMLACLRNPLSVSSTKLLDVVLFLEKSDTEIPPPSPSDPLSHENRKSIQRVPLYTQGRQFLTISDGGDTLGGANILKNPLPPTLPLSPPFNRRRRLDREPSVIPPPHSLQSRPTPTSTSSTSPTKRQWTALHPSIRTTAAAASAAAASSGTSPRPGTARDTTRPTTTKSELVLHVGHTQCKGPYFSLLVSVRTSLYYVCFSVGKRWASPSGATPPPTDPPWEAEGEATRSGTDQGII